MEITALTDWLLEPDNALSSAQVLAAFVTALATLALWRVTRVLAKETKNLAEQTSKPFVVTSLESTHADASAMDLVVRNTGNAAAFDVRVKVSPRLPGPAALDDELNPIEGFSISMLPPGKAVGVRGTPGHEAYGTTFTTTISWSDRPGSTSREGLEYSFSARDLFEGGFNTKGVHHIAVELERIRKKMPNA